MKSNEEVIQAFVENKELENRNLYSYGTTLVNYLTTLAQRVDSGIIVNKTTYSTTTTKIQNELERQLHEAKIAYLVVTDVPFETKNLTKYIKQNEVQE